jgi:hypothetical protein
MSVRRALSWLLAVGLLAVPVRPALGQPDEHAPAIPFEGTEVFAYLLKSRGYAPVPTVADLHKETPEDTLIILLGRLDGQDGLIAQLRDLQIAGYNVLLASDYAHRLDAYGVAIAGRDVRTHADECYRQKFGCPLIKALEPNASQALRPLTQGLGTNRPSYFVPTGPRPPRLQLLAGFKVGRRIGAGLVTYSSDPAMLEHAVRRPDGWLILPNAYIADSDAQAAGRAVLIAGSGVFTNGMLLQPDNDNLPFATECLDWLGQRPDGTPRRHALLIADGTAISSFDVGLDPRLPMPPIPAPTIGIINQLLHGIEREGILFRILEDMADVRLAVRFGLIALTVGLLCYGAKKLTEQRYHGEKGSALLSGPYAVPPDAAPLSEQRARAQIERNALGAEARALVRAWFLETCGMAPADWDHKPTSPPPEAIVTGWWQGMRMRRQIARLARLARPSVPTAFSWVEMVRLTKVLQSLSAAVHEGRLRFAGCSTGENS